MDKRQPPGRSDRSPEEAQRLRGLIEHLPEGIVLTDEYGTVVDWNRGAERATGLSRERVVGKPAWELPFAMVSLPGIDPQALGEGPADIAARRALVESLLEPHHAASGIEPAKFILTRPDGTIKIIQASAFVVQSERGNGLGAILRDVTHLQARRRRAGERAMIFRLIAENVRDVVYLYRLGPTPGYEYMSPSVLAAWGYSAEEFYADSELIFRFVAPEDRPLLKRALRDPTEFPEPLVLKCKRKDETDCWTEQQLTPVLNESGELVAIEGLARDVTERVRAERESAVGIERLKAVFEGTVRALGSMAEQRDPYTAGHQERVAELSVAIAEVMGLDPDRLEGLSIGAQLHDIGKIAVPVEILSTPGELDVYQRGLINTHAQVGYDILKIVDFPWPIAEMTLQHHERMDGSGYPRALAGDQIMLEARIIGVADSIEAMSSFRPYRPALGLGKALEEIAHSGGAFDEAVLDACVVVFYEKKFRFSTGEARGPTATMTSGGTAPEGPPSTTPGGLE